MLGQIPQYAHHWTHPPSGNMPLVQNMSAVYSIVAIPTSLAVLPLWPPAFVWKEQVLSNGHCAGFVLIA